MKRWTVSRRFLLNLQLAELSKITHGLSQGLNVVTSTDGVFKSFSAT